MTMKRESPTVAVSYEAVSFLLFLAASVAATAIAPTEYPVFVVLLLIDGLGTLLDSDMVVGVDRSCYLLALVIVMVGEGGIYDNVFVLFSGVLLAVTALDLSFLFRKMRKTVADRSVLGARLRSYAYTLGLALLLSCTLTVAYSRLAGIEVEGLDPLALLVLAATSALVAVYEVARHLSWDSIRRAPAEAR